MARIVVLGADGMIGHMIRVYLTEQGHEVSSVARKESAYWDKLDVSGEPKLLKYLAKKRPEFVINGMGVLVKESAENPERAIRLNALIPQLLAANGARLGYRFVQLSSDCVFSGNHGPYQEKDFRDADDVYGRAKALGEVNNDRDLTIRTSKVGPELKRGGSGLFEWFMGLKGVTKGFDKALWGGVTTLEVSKFLDFYVRNPIVGVFHLTNNEPISKHDLISLFAQVWNKTDVVIERDSRRASDRSLLCTRTEVAYSVPSYLTMLEELNRFMLKHQELYPHYYA